MRVVIKIGLLLIGCWLLASSLVLMIYRDTPFEDEWATVARVTQIQNDYTITLSLFHPESRFERDLVAIQSNAFPETLRWSSDGKWLLMALQPNLNEPSLYRLDWRARAFEPIPQIQRSFALRATHWSPDGKWGILVETRRYRGDVFAINSTGTEVKALISDIPFFVVPPYIKWSPLGEWAIGAFSESDQQTALYRIDGKTLSIQSLPFLQGTLESMIVSPDGEWVYYALRTDFGEPLIKLFRMRPDGTQREEIANQVLSFIPDLWWTDDGQLMAVVEELAGTNYFIGRVDVSQHAIIPLIENLPMTSRRIWSHQRDYVAMTVTTEDEAYILLITADGSQQWRFPTQSFCTTIAPRWSADDTTLIFLRRRDENSGVCEFHQAWVGTDNIEPIFEPSQVGYEVDLGAADHSNWMSVAHLNNAGNAYITELMHRQTREIIDLERGRVLAWSSVPIPAEDNRLAVIVGVGCIGVTLMTGLLFRRK